MSIPRRIRLPLFVAGGVVTLVVVLLLALPFLIDANSYRGTIEAKAEELLGREVRLGEISLSFLPLGVHVADLAVQALPDEGGGDLIAVRSLRVGARLQSLLAGRLDVTSVNLDGPSLVLERAADGSWNVQRLFAGPAGPAGEPGGAAQGGSGPAVTVDRVRVTNGRIVARATTAAGKKVEAEIGGLDIDARDLALDREVRLQVAASLTGAALRLEGSAGPFQRPPGTPFRLVADVQLDKIAPERLREIATAFAGLSIPDGMIGGDALSAGAAVQATFVDGPDGLSLREAEVTRLTVADLELTLVRRRDGGWSFDDLGAAAGAPQTGSTADGPAVSIGGVEITQTRVRIVDESADPPRELALAGLTLRVDGLPTETAAKIELETRLAVDGKEVGNLETRGSVGPLPRDDGPVPVDLFVGVSGLRLASAAPFLRDLTGMDLPSGSLTLEAKVNGAVADRFGASGTLDLSGVEVRVASTDGSARSLPLDADMFFDLAWSQGGDLLELRQLDINLEGNPLAIRGTINTAGKHPEVDLRLEPSSVMADDLARLIAAAGIDLPFAMSSDRPIGIEARARGEVGGARPPEVSGKLTLAGFSFRHPSMAQPLEDVAAVVSLEGETVRVDGLQARVGGSDLAGEVSARGFDAPRVEFALRSRRADFWELMSFVGGDAGEGSTPAGGTAADEGDFLAGVVARGTLAIGEGSFQTLDFTELDAGMKLEGRVLTLDPFRMKLYDGGFRGAATLDLRQEPAAFRVRSDLQEVDVNRLLADNLQMDGVLGGKFTGNLEVSGAGTSVDAIVRALSGGGSILVTDGNVGKLDVLGTLSKATGVFGETTLQSLSGKLAREGTPFDRLSAGVRIEGGKARSSDLLLASPDLVLKGKATVDLLAATMDGDVQVIFSRALSDSMRAEGSRAAQAFWDPKIDQVNLPVTLSGPFEAPTPGIEWKTAVGNVARRKAEETLKEELGGLGGLLGGGAAGGAASSLAPAAEASGSGATAAHGSGDVVAEISRVRWGGSFLVKDLKIDGAVRGRNISHASLVVTDSGGKELKRIERLNEIENYFGSGVDRALPAAIDWDATVDGKALATGSKPFLVTLTVFDTAGGTQMARTEAR